MKVAIRVEGSPDIGLGHVMRCMALSQSLVAAGHKVIFLMSKHSAAFCQSRGDWQAEIHPIANVSIDQEANWLAQQTKALQVDWLVLDGYQFSQAYRQVLSMADVNLAVFDDMNNSGNLYADMVINGAASASALNYQKSAPNAVLALGQDYQVLRQEFLHSNPDNWQQRQQLTLSFGGSDPKNLTLELLAEFQTLGATMPITVITGAAYIPLEQLKNFIKNSDLQINHQHDCQNMADVFTSTKLAVAAAGGSQFELRACAVPSILVVVAENQRLASQDAATQAWCQVVELTDSQIPKDSIKALAKQCLGLYQQTTTLYAMHQKALTIPTTDGAHNITQLLIANQTKLRACP